MGHLQTANGNTQPHHQGVYYTVSDFTKAVICKFITSLFILNRAFAPGLEVPTRVFVDKDC